MQAVFLDRDGVLNRRRTDHVKSLAEFELLPGVTEAVERLSAAGLRLFVITNQSVIGRGLAAREVVEAIHQRLREHMPAIEAVLYCPHAPEDGCDCRKPRPGLLLQAAEGYNLDLSRCVLIGDSPTDVQAAEAAGCRGMLIPEGGLPQAVDQLLG